MMNHKLTPLDGNEELYEKDIKRNVDSFHAYYEKYANHSVYELIQYLAEAMAYQYSVNRYYKKQERDLLIELRKCPQE
jgi:hypothetical protein